jgi:hypothetical protein
MRRRAVLATLGTGVFAGCSSINALGGPSFEKAPADEAVSNPKELHVGDENKSGTSARLTLQKEQYFPSGFAWPNRFRLRIEGQVVKNGPIDIYLLTNNQLIDYQKQPQIVNAAMKEESVESIDVDKKFDPGQYQLVFDNTNVGDTSPSGTAEVQFKAEILGQGQGQGTPTPTPSG